MYHIQKKLHSICAKYIHRALYGNIAEKIIRNVCFANYIDIMSKNVDFGHIHMPRWAFQHLAISKVTQYKNRMLRGETHGLRKGTGNGICEQKDISQQHLGR